MNDMESTFDPQTFLNTEVEGEMETKYTPVPTDTYTSVIEDISVQAVSTDRGEAIILNVTHLLVGVDELAEEMGMERLTVRQGIWLDVDPDGSIALGPNKNVKLGNLREAVGQNNAGTWNFNMLKGAGPLRIAVSIKPDATDPTVRYNRVDKTLPLTVAA